VTSPSRRVASVTTVSLLPAIAGLVALLALAQVLDRAAWAGLAVGQSVGAMASIVVAGGWALTGPSALAGESAPTRRSLYEASVRLRGGTAVLAVPLAVALTAALLGSGAGSLGVAVCASAGLAGLSPRWFLVGAGGAKDLLRFEALPLVVANLAAAAAVAAGSSPLVYPAVTAAAQVGAALALLVVLRRSAAPDPTVRVTWRSRGPATVTELVGGAYSTINVALVSIQVSVVALAGYASGWKLYQWGILVISGSCQALQSWVATAPDQRPRRFRTALTFHGVIGFVGLGGFALLGAPLTSALFGPELQVSADVAFWFGTAVLFLSLNSSLGRHTLVTSQRVDIVLRSTVLGAVAGVPLILFLAGTHGAVGGAAALAVTEAFVFSYQLAAGWRFLRDPVP
jgi:O-antigen/teichoic acid export membrane protein